MRNLKRALSLALASVMLLGMMVVGTSAASYTDVDEKDNVEAIEVLNAVGVMIGRQGNFEPDEAVNRHEMAVIMAKLVLGNEVADNYAGSHPYTDVVPWADKYVAACYENGIVAGKSSTTYNGSDPLTAVEAAAMMLRALGYKDLEKGNQGDWRAPFTAMANQIRLFDGVASNPNEKLNRNQVAQLTLNTLKSPVVDTKEGLSISGSNGDYTFTIDGNREYIVRSSLDSYARAISSIESKGNSASGVGGYTIELGEHLYNGKLKLIDDTDDFGRPARTWEYDGKQVGSYAKTELLRAEYTEEVTGKDLYDLLGKSTIESDDYDFTISVDGEDRYNKDNGVKGVNTVFNETNMNRNNKTAVGGTGNGVLTQVFVDTGKKEVRIAVINTYLAKAAGDYNEKRDDVSLDVYAISKATDTKSTYFWKNTDNEKTSGVRVSGEDFAISGVKEGDAFLVTVADGKVQTLRKAEVLSSETLTAFKTGGSITTASKGEIKRSNTAKYDVDVLDVYTGSKVNLKEKSYNVYMDAYGYFIGVDLVESDDNYLFLAGLDLGTSDITAEIVKAVVLFTDGTDKTVDLNWKDSTLTTKPPALPYLTNLWCTYTVDSKGVYTVKEVAAAINDGTDGNPVVKVAQYHSDVNNKDIDRKNVSMDGGTGYTKIYGNDDTVYMVAELDSFVTKTGVTLTNTVISGVDSYTVGVENTSLTTMNAAAVKTAEGHANNAPGGTYALYKDNGYIIAAVVVAKDNAASKNLAYVHTGSLDRETYNSADDEWTWTRKVIINGEETSITERGSSLKWLDKDVMKKGNWYQVKYNANGDVIGLSAETAVGNVGTWSLVTATGNSSAGDEGTYVKRIDWLEFSYNKEDNVLYTQSFANEPKAPRCTGTTLYATTTDSTGVRVAEDVKVVLIQTNDLKETTTFETGKDQLKQTLDLLNKAEDGKFDYTISMIIEDGRATAVIIKDANDATGNKGEDEKEPPKGGDVYVDLSTRTDVKVYTKDYQMSEKEALDAIMDALEEIYGEGKVERTEDETTPSTWYFTANGYKYTFDYQAGGKVAVGAIAYTLNGEAVLGTDGTNHTVGNTRYDRWSNDGGENWTYVTGGNIPLAAGIEIETGFVKLAGTGANDTNLAGVIKKDSDYYAKEDTVVRAASGAKGSSYTSNSKLCTYGTYNFGQINDTVDGTDSDATATFTAVAQWALTYYDASDAKQVKGVADEFVLTTTEAPGKWFYIDSVSGTPIDVTNVGDTKITKDTTIYGNYVKVANISVVNDDNVAFDCAWSVAKGDYVKMNSTITFTATASEAIATGNSTNLKLEATTKTGATAETPTCDDATAGAGATAAAGSYTFADDLSLASGKKVTMTFTPFTADVTLVVTITKGVD